MPHPQHHRLSQPEPRRHRRRLLTALFPGALTALLLGGAGVSWGVSSLVFVQKWGVLGSGNGQFREPSDVAVGPTGNVFVADRGNHRIQVFTNSGGFVTAWGDSGTGNGQFNSPRDVHVAANGEVYVTDFFNDRIQVFSSTGVYLRQWGTTGTGDGQFRGPRGVVVDDSSHVFVSEDGLPNKRVQKFTTTGGFLAKWGSFGTGNGQFQSPRSIAVDASSNVYVSDALNSRIEKFTSMGAFTLTWGQPGTGDGDFQFTGGVTWSPGRVLVVDTNNHRLESFDPSGNFAEAMGSPCNMADGTGCVDPDAAGPLALGDGQFYFPLGIAEESDGDVFVADSRNNRIQKFRRLHTSSAGPSRVTLDAVSVSPNPMRTSTSVRLDLAESSLAGVADRRVTARVYDSTGRLVRELFAGSLPAGDHTLGWDGRSLGGALVPPGVYFLDVQVDDAPGRTLKIVRLH